MQRLLILIIGLTMVLGNDVISLQDKKIAELIQQLGNEDWQKREVAQEKLIEYGTKLINQYRKFKLSKDKKTELEETKSDLEKFAIELRKATRSKDPEMRFRTSRFIRPTLYQNTMPKIAFLSPAPHQIRVMDINGMNPKKLTNTSDNKLFNGYPTWSPDGQKIAFTSDRDGNREIYVMTIDGNDQKNLTNNFSEDDTPHWSPDGKQIAFRSSRKGSMYVYVMDTNGKNVRRLSPQPGYDPSWSPHVLEELSLFFESN